MNGEIITTSILCDVMRELEETVENANLLALEMALKSLEEGLATDTVPVNGNVGDLANRAAHATEEFEKLVRRLQAA